jgi:predicted Fe-Mo cluster-binding NifX family protein
MKVCITAEGPDLKDPVDSRFGRAQYFIIYDDSTQQHESFENPNLGGLGGVGVQSGQLMEEQGVQAVITGHVGPNAFATLNAAGIEVYAGAAGSIQDALDSFKAGKLQKVDSATTGKHRGMGRR